MSSITELKDVLKGALDFIGKEEDKKAPEVSKMNEEGNLYSLFGAPFLMSDDIVVKGCDLTNGMLTIELEKIIPEEKRARLIPIGKNKIKSIN